MGKPIIGFFIGDAHVLGDTGLCIPGFHVGSKDKRPYSASYKQKWLYDKFRDFTQFVELLSVEYDLFIGIGGDNVDGVMHHESTQTCGTRQDQIDMAVELFKPLVGMARWCYGVTGTAAHVGDVGDDDRAVYEALGVDYSDFFELEISGRLLWWSHHGLPVGTREHTLENGAMALVRDIDARCMRDGKRKPDAIVGHDRHRTFEPFNLRGVSAAVSPCWQLPTYYGMRWPFTQVSVGYLMWRVSENVIERRLYEQPSRTVRAI